MLQPRPPPLTPPHRGLFDSHFSESDSSPMGYADPPLGTTAYAGSESRDSKDSRFSASDIDRANQKCAFNSRKRGERERGRSAKNHMRSPCRLRGRVGRGQAACPARVAFPPPPLPPPHGGGRGGVPRVRPRSPS